MPSSRISFLTDDGLTLAARLELPDAEPQCYAVMSHCFTCNKDMISTYRISKALAQRGIATLRFDFRGLGDSDGEFVDSNFSTQISDIDAAIRYLSQHHAAPEILIGHSLGGTAALACAGDHDSVLAAVTIASPSQPSHVLHHFTDAIVELNSGNNTHINVGGSEYEVSPGFVDDLLAHDMEQRLAALHKPVLVFEVMGDDIVDANNAGDIVAWNSGETTYVQLEATDHLISDKATAVLIANRIQLFIKDLV